MRRYLLQSILKSLKDKKAIKLWGDRQNILGCGKVTEKVLETHYLGQ
jgi:hypothetical protein